MTMSAGEFLTRMAQGNALPAPKCQQCGKDLRESVTGNRRMGHGWVDSDCYFEEIGKIVEEHPIRTARIRRG